MEDISIEVLDLGPFAVEAEGLATTSAEDNSSVDDPVEESTVLWTGPDDTGTIEFTLDCAFAGSPPTSLVSGADIGWRIQTRTGEP